MEARELRIRNWVKSKVHIPILDGHNIWHQVNSIMIRDCEHYKDDWSCEPIPLTPEILEKAGFKWNIYHQAFHRADFVYDLNSKHPEGSGYSLDTFRRVDCIVQPIKYLHQLQNIFYCLTGEELTINL